MPFAPLGLVALCSGLLLSPHACAAPGDAPSELKPVIVTASGQPQTLGSEVAASSVLTRADLERAGVRDLVSALQLLGTSWVEQLGGPGTAAVVRLRGGDSRDTLVLVDGVPLTDVTSGQVSISQIPVDWVERVEVVRGNMSALYGGNASGGVIQIFTRRGAPGLQSRIDVGGGSQGTRFGRVSISGGNEVVRARLGLGEESSSGFSAANPSIAPLANPDDDGHRRRDATLVVDARIADGQNIGLDLREFTGRADYDDPLFGAPADTHVSHIAQRAATLRGQHRLASAWTLGWRVAQTEENRSDDTVGSFAPSSFGNELHTRVAAADLNGALGGGWALQFGAERLTQSTDNATYTQQERRTDSLRAGTTYHAGWGSLQANVRRDHSAGFGDAGTGLLGGTFELGRGFSLIGNVGTSFTPPTLDFLYFDCSGFGSVCNNPLLRPEKSRNADLALQWENATSLVRATLFATRWRDKIVSDAAFVPQNVDRARNKGLEITGRTVFDSWRLSGEASFQDPVNEATGERLPRRARQQFTLRVDKELNERFSLGAGVRHIGSRIETTGQPLAAYSVAGASAQWQAAKEWSVQATVENLFDKRYEPSVGYNGRPRGVFVTVSWQPALQGR